MLVHSSDETLFVGHTGKRMESMDDVVHSRLSPLDEVLGKKEIDDTELLGRLEKEFDVFHAGELAFLLGKRIVLDLMGW